MFALNLNKEEIDEKIQEIVTKISSFEKPVEEIDSRQYVSLFIKRSSNLTDEEYN